MFSGYFLTHLMSTNRDTILRNLTHIILDEVHEREQSTDILMLALKEAMQMHKHLKLILMSATLDANKFSGYFGNCIVINVPGKLFDVEVLYLGDILLTTKFQFEGLEGKIF